MSRVPVVVVNGQFVHGSWWLDEDMFIIELITIMIINIIILVIYIILLIFLLWMFSSPQLCAAVHCRKAPL